MSFRLELLAQDGAARRGRLHTAHGTVETPAFMPVGTAATVKAMSAEMVRATGAEIVLANTYHLMLRPGAERIERLGGLHRFMAWPDPILTDSGGYQVMSLAARRQIDEDGVVFSSHLDGSRHALPPERAVAIQDMLDATITMVLDECPSYPISYDDAAASMRRSMRWAERCRKVFRAREGYGLFGIVQGSTDAGLRRESAGRLIEIGFDGYAIGGLAVGEAKPMMQETVEVTCKRAAGRAAALPDGGRQARRPGGRDRARGRHVRLRAADPLGPHRPGLDPDRSAQPQERAPRRRSGADRSGLRLPGVPRPRPRLPAPSGEGERDPGCDAADLRTICTSTRA